MRISGTFIGALALWAMTSGAFANGMLRADGHAPIGVMGNHRHKSGEFMVSYRFMYMDMEGNRIADTQLSDMLRLYESGAHKTHVNLGFSIPTGSTPPAKGSSKHSGRSAA
jgi:hypothetical protein